MLTFQLQDFFHKKMLANSFFCAVKKHYPSIANGRLDSFVFTKNW